MLYNNVHDLPRDTFKEFSNGALITLTKHMDGKCDRAIMKYNKKVSIQKLYEVVN